MKKKGLEKVTRRVVTLCQVLSEIDLVLENVRNGAVVAWLDGTLDRRARTFHQQLLCVLRLGCLQGDAVIFERMAGPEMTYSWA
jgi:hypothetical protein